MDDRFFKSNDHLKACNKKVLHVAYSRDIGGASIAMQRIHDSLVNLNVSSKILTIIGDRNFTDSMLFKTRLSQKVHNFFVRLLGVVIRAVQKTNYKTTRSINIIPSGLAKFINNSDFDIVHFHWIGNETISIKEISSIKKTIVWTMHDLWAVLGAEHNNISNSIRYKDGYNRHNKISGYFGVDIEQFTWYRKKKYWQNINFNIVAVSNWEKSVFQQSFLFRKFKITVIGNPIDKNIWYPADKDKSRTSLSLPTDTKLILYGANHFLIDPIKGFELFKSSLQYLKLKDFQIICFGSTVPVEIEDLKVHNFGKINDVNLLIALYSCADVYVLPSLQETFGQTALEAISCNTPVVAFKGSGIDDIIDHKINGYLATPYSCDDLAKGIAWTIDNLSKEKKIYNEEVYKKFSMDVIGTKYLNLYNSL